MAEAIAEDPAWYCWHASRRQAMLEACWEKAGAFVHQQIIWVKDRGVLTRSHYLWKHEPCFMGWIRGSRPPNVAEETLTSTWALRRILGRDNFTISLDSSSPHRIAGVQRSLVVPSHFTNDEKTWKISAWPVPQDIRLARGEKFFDFPFASPFAKYMQINDLLAHDKDDSDYFTDAWAENNLVSHNIYSYHRAGIDACDLIFHDQKRDMSRVPDPYAEIVGLVDEYFTSETPFAIEQRLTELLKLRQVEEPRDV